MKNIRSFIVGLLTGAILFSSIAVAAAGDLKVTAIISDVIKMKLYGKDFNPKETDGTYLKPITYNGRTYLPVRPLAEALGIPVEWDDITKTVWLGGKTETIAVNNNSLYQDESRTILTTDIDLLTTSSKIYKWGVTHSKPLNSVYFRCIFKPAGKYGHFTASLFLTEDEDKPFTIDFKKETRDGVVLKSVTLNPGETIEIDIDITSVNQIYMDSQAGSISRVIIGEPTFKNVPKN